MYGVYNSKLGEVWVFGGWGCRDQMVATWFNNYIPTFIQTAHTGTSSETGLILLGKKDPEGFSLKGNNVLGMQMKLESKKTNVLSWWSVLSPK